MLITLGAPLTMGLLPCKQSLLNLPRKILLDFFLGRLKATLDGCLFSSVDGGFDWCLEEMFF